MSRPLNEVERELLESEAARCRRCRAGEYVPCDGVRAEYDPVASEFYGATKIVYVPCDYYRQLHHRNALERAVMMSGLPSKWITAERPKVPAELTSGKPCVVAPSELTPSHTVASSHMVQSAVMALVYDNIPSRYWFFPSLTFSDLDGLRTDLGGRNTVAIDRWDGGSQHESLVAEMCGLVEERITADLPLIIGLLRPVDMLEPRVDAEVPLIGMFQDLPRVVV